MSLVKSSLLRLLRDNPLANPVGRELVKAVGRFGVLEPLAIRYRAFGQFEVSWRGASFRVESKGDDHFANALFYGLTHESPELDLVQAHARRGGQFVDVGANTGMFSLLAAATNPAVRVTAIEPAPANARRLEQNFRLNPRLDARLVTVALGEAAGNLELEVPADGSISTVASANLGFSSRFHAIATRPVQVRVDTLDAVLRATPLSAGDLLKIDVETYELAVLGGAEATLAAGPDLLIEIWHPDTLAAAFPHLAGTLAADHPARVEALLRRHGYRPHALGPTGVTPIESLEAAKEEVNYFFTRRALAGPVRFDALFA